jgi:Flp pilus assembly protein TadD
VAQKFYETALKIVPNEPSVMSNLGLSYALSKNMNAAESTLRQAAQNPRADQRVRQNLALVLALQGKMAEAERITRQDLSPQDAEANIRALRSLVSQPNSWQALRKAEGSKPAPRSKTAQKKPQSALDEQGLIP